MSKTIARKKTIFSCQHCGYQSPKWLGKCPDCNSWNSFIEEDYAPAAASGRDNRRGAAGYDRPPVLLKDVEVTDAARTATGIIELDRVLGGGIVTGSVVLIGGDPGIGKSTISLQISNQLTAAGRTVLYVSGEESVAQTKLRAQRLGAGRGGEKLYIVNQTDLALVTQYIRELKPDAVFIDSIQVLFDAGIGSAPGSVSQVRECAGILTQLAKSSGTSVFIIGHVTKEGTLAGPRVLEHIVDTVLYFEGDRFSTYRILRAVKNRFGSTNEIGVFEMASEGLKEVRNPSEIFLSERPKDVSGSVVVSTVEGGRALLVEVQSLVSRSNFGYATRRAHGFDFNRLTLLVAVLEKRMGLALESQDIFVNVAGGFKIEDPACDLGVTLAVASAFLDRTVRADTAVLGEVGLTGEIRSISQIAVRLNEAQKLGFKQCVVPANSVKGLKAAGIGITLIPVSTLKEAMDLIIEGRAKK
ncbi:MAG TPA: DNA repair protein RadA [Candidatus Omnitrophota bacterium]|nr:DNA repair protein RadA [Candidatus Omnitrophota bacterium]HQJ15315.1 DNA repair protein RadA [Candidatus Omnitrophota bacterium]